MNEKYIHIYNNLINYTRNKDLYKNLNREDNFSDRLTLFLLHFSFFLKNYKNEENKKILQEIYDYNFRQLELSIREIGYGDATVNKKMKSYVNLMYLIVDQVELWEKLNLIEKTKFFSNLIEVNKESSFFINYFNKYADYLSKKPLNYFTNDVISLKF